MGTLLLLLHDAFSALPLLMHMTSPHRTTVLVGFPLGFSLVCWRSMRHASDIFPPPTAHLCLLDRNEWPNRILFVRLPRATALAREGGREGLYLQRPRETSGGGGHGTHDDDDVAVCLAFSPLGRLLVEFRMLPQNRARATSAANIISVNMLCMCVHSLGLMSCPRTYRDVTYGPTPMSWDFLSIGRGPKGVRQTCKEERGHPHCYVVLYT